MKWLQHLLMTDIHKIATRAHNSARLCENERQSGLLRSEGRELTVTHECVQSFLCVVLTVLR